jgi:hypothetical protein
VRTMARFISVVLSDQVPRACAPRETPQWPLCNGFVAYSPGD